MLLINVKVNDDLTLTEVQVTNEGKWTEDETATVYMVKVKGIDNGHYPFEQQFDVIHFNGKPLAYLIADIFTEIGDRLTRR